ncbi:MAG: hypothetical protein AAF289_01415 [Cyanobacteria bacterium P01_A01_bin.135]
MTHADNRENLPATQQQSIRDVQVQGNDNIFNAIQAKVVTLTQNKIIQVSVDEIKTRPFVITSPYKGLRSFEPEDKDQFFGRDQFIAGLINELEQTNLILLLGASGSGKSSVVRAGVVPWLCQQWGTRLVSLTLTPDQDPFDSLYASLLSRFRQSEAQLARVGQTDTLSQLVTQLKQPDSYWFIFIDQFEELFTTSDSAKRDRFITSLVQLCQDYAADPNLKVMATMRADFLDRLDADPANRLARLTEKHRPLMTQMHPDELRLAIEQPAAHHGVVFEQGLVETIIKDVQGQAGYLPLLQYTLDQLWDSEVRDGGIHDRTLNIQSYRLLGGVRGALQKRVSQIYQGLSNPEQQAAQRIFLKLVGVGGDRATDSDWKPVRKRELRSRFMDPLEQAVLVKLIDASLLVSDAPAASSASEATVEIAHEVLLTSWDELRGWIEQNREAIALRNRINEDAAHWELEKLDDELWGGTKLGQAVDLQNDPTFNHILGGFSPGILAFIDASVSYRDRQKNAEEERRQRELENERKARKSAQRLTISMAIAGVLLSISGITSGLQWRKAEIGWIESLTQSANASFAANRVSMDGLISALEAGSRLQDLPFGGSNQDLQTSVLTALMRSMYWTREKNILQDHQDIVQNVSFSPNGELIATASYDNTVKLWRQNGSLLKTLTGHTAPVMSVDFSYDGKLIASGSMDGSVRIWSSSGELIQTILAHDDWVFGVGFGPDNQIATASNDETVKLWRLQDGHLLQTLEGHQAPVRQVEFSPGGDQIVTVSDDRTIKRWSKGGEVLTDSLEEHSDTVMSVSFSHDGQLFVTGSLDGTIKLWSRNGRLLRSFEHPEQVWSVDISDEETIVSSSPDGTLRLWSLDGQLLDAWDGHEGQIPSIALGSDGKVLASAGNDGSVKLWQLDRSNLTVLKEHQGAINWIDFSSNSNQIASASTDGTVKLWNRDSKTFVKLEENDARINTVSFSYDSKLIASGSDDQKVKIWDENGGLQEILEGHQDRVMAVSFSPSSQTIASASADGTVKIWGLLDNETTTLEEHEGRVLSLAFSPDGKTIATAGDDQTAILWSAQGEILQTLRGHNDTVRHVAFSPDGETIVTASADRTVKLWQKNGTLITTLTGHRQNVARVAFSPDSSMIASASSDKTIKLWRRSGALIATLYGHEGSIYAVDFSPDSKWLASGGKDKSIILWNIANLSLNNSLKRGCSQIRDYLDIQLKNSQELCN